MPLVEGKHLVDLYSEDSMRDQVGNVGSQTGIQDQSGCSAETSHRQQVGRSEELGKGGQLCEEDED
jgi:hypothetical protein